MRAFEYDAMGRQIRELLTALGEAVDGSVRRIETEYDIRGLPGNPALPGASGRGVGSRPNTTSAGCRAGRSSR